MKLLNFKVLSHYAEHDTLIKQLTYLAYATTHRTTILLHQF